MSGMAAFVHAEDMEAVDKLTHFRGRVGAEFGG